MLITELASLNHKLVKDLRIALKDFEPMVKNPHFLWNGREIKNFSLRPREAWANWLICTVLRKMRRREITFMEDDAGDGFIVDKDLKLAFQTEHVSALDVPKGRRLPSGEQRIIDAINLKIERGDDYAREKLLVVFSMVLVNSSEAKSAKVFSVDIILKLYFV
ncbi:MAG: hypothetical protein HZB11_02255 [Candidatus Yonathbacteria bacterium]|nr:hypothetical protein [Candidatus Yonathbacteria bacterium]